MTLRSKLTLAYAALLVGTMVVAGIAGLGIARRGVEAEIRERSRTTAVELAADLDRLLRAGRLDNRSASQLLVGYVKQRPEVTEAEVLLPGHPGQVAMVLRFDLAGPRLEQVPTRPPEPPRTVTVAREGADGRTLRIAAPFGSQGSAGAVTLTASLATADLVAKRLGLTFTGVGALAVLLLIGVSWLLTDRLVTSHLNRLHGVMGRVAAGESIPRLPAELTTRSDELGALSRDFEQMLQAVDGAAAQRESLLERTRQFNEELAQRVEQATRDLHEKNRALSELNDALVRARTDLAARERMAALGQLAGTIAHEVGNPLNAISGHVQLVLREPDLPEAAREDLELVRREVDRAVTTIRRFLDSTGRPKARPKRVDVEQLMQQVVQLSLSGQDREQVQARIEVADDARELISDPALLRQILLNLVTNAVDAMDRRGALTLRSVADGDQLMISVSDSGPGLDEKTRARLFEPFYTTKAPGRGSGLGLSIVKELSRALGGSTFVDSQPSHGATLGVRLPSFASRDPA